jgi:surface protein
MTSMFGNSIFNGDISNWDTGNVEDISSMFENSKFTGDISKWDTSFVT